MATIQVWAPDSNARDVLLEIPIRTPHSPANLWIHWSGLAADWAGFPPDVKTGDWHRAPGIVTVPVHAGDKVIAGQASVAISAAHREEQGLLRTDDWGMAIDSVVPISGHVEGPGTVVFAASFATLGNCWPVGVTLTIDLLVLRSSLLPITPPPYGDPPKPTPGVHDRVRDTIDDRAAHVADFKRVNARAAGVSMGLTAQLSPDRPAYTEAQGDPVAPTKSARDARKKPRA